MGKREAGPRFKVRGGWSKETVESWLGDSTILVARSTGAMEGSLIKSLGGGDSDR